LLVEVLSESTAAYDRGLKFELYRRCESLREYVLVEQDRQHVDLFRREVDGRWVLVPVDAAGVVAFASLGVDMDMDAIYEDVAPPEAASPAPAP
jgi:Uma2 family endonuclease